MIIGIAQAFNGLHKQYNKELNKLGVKTFYFDIDSPSWIETLLNKKYDAILWHADAKDEEYRIIHDRIFFIENILKKPVFPNMNQYFAYNDKTKQLEIFKTFKIPTIPTQIFNDKQKAINFIKKTNYPFIVKNVNSYGGIGVYKIDTKKQALELVNKIFTKNGYKGIKDYFYTQKFVKDMHQDLRIISIGNKVKFSYWRINEEDWKTNVGQGSRVSLDNIPKSAIKLCEKLNKIMKYEWMSYDIIMSKGKPYMTEMACNFATEGIEAQGKNVRIELAKQIVKKIK